MKNYLILLISVFAFSLSSCNKFEDVEITKIETVSLVSFDQNGIEAVISAVIKNPNRSGFTIYKSGLNATVNGIDIGKAHLKDKVKIKGKSETAHDFHIRSDFSNLKAGDLPKIMAMALKRSVDIHLQGKLKVGKYYLKYPVHIDVKKSVPLSGM